MSEKPNVDLKSLKPKGVTVTIPSLIGVLGILAAVIFIIDSNLLNMINATTDGLINALILASYGIIILMIIFSLKRIDKLNEENKNLYKEFENYQEPGKFGVQQASEQFNKINIYRKLKELAREGESNLPTEEIIENEIETFENNISGIKYYAQVSVVIGIFGTFLGLLLAVKGASATLSSLQNISSDTKDIIPNLMESLTGLDVAFYTSIVGILSSLSLGLGYLFLKRDRIALVLELERLMPYMIVEIIKKEDRVETKLKEFIKRNSNLKDDIVSAIKASIGDLSSKIQEEFSQEFEKLLVKINKEFNDLTSKFSTTNESFNVNVQNFNNYQKELVNKLQKILENFEEAVVNEKSALEKNRKELSEFWKDAKENVVNNLEALYANLNNAISVAADKMVERFNNEIITEFSENLNSYNKIIVENHDQLFDDFNNRIINRLENSVGDFSNNIKSSIERWNENLNELKKKIEETNANLAEAYEKQINTATSNFEKANNGFNESMKEYLKETEEKINNINGAFEKFKEENDKYFEKLKTESKENILEPMKEKIKEVQTSVETFTESANKILENYNNNKDSVKELTKTLNILNNNFNDANKKLEEYKTLFKGIKEILENEANRRIQEELNEN